MIIGMIRTFVKVSVFMEANSRRLKESQKYGSKLPNEIIFSMYAKSYLIRRLCCERDILNRFQQNKTFSQTFLSDASW